MKIAISNIVVDESLNPRKRYGGSSEPGREGATVEEIAESMRQPEIGQTTPILVEKVDPKQFEGREYRVREGFRRLRAAKILGWTEVDASVFEGRWIDQAAVASNTARSNYTPPELAFIVDHFTTPCRKKSLDGREGLGLTAKEAAGQIGLSQASISQYTKVVRGVDASILRAWLRAPGAFRFEELQALATMTPEQQHAWYAKRSDVVARRHQAGERHGPRKNRAKRIRRLAEEIDAGRFDRRGEEWKAGARAVIEFWETGEKVEP